MLLRARALNPEGRWVARLARFYRDALLGSQSHIGPKQHASRQPRAPRSPYVTALRARSSRRRPMTNCSRRRRGFSPVPARVRGWMSDPAAWAESCLTRALQINPRAVFARNGAARPAEARRNADPLWRVAPADRDAYVAALPERRRFEELPGLAKDAFGMVAEFDRLHDDNLRGRFELGRDQAKRYATDALKLAPKVHRRSGLRHLDLHREHER